MSRFQWFTLLLVVLVVVAALINWKMPMSPGLDIAGGYRVVLQANPRPSDVWPRGKGEREERLKKMRSIAEIIRDRIKSGIKDVEGLKGVTEPIVHVEGDDRVVVELPGVKDREAALKWIQSMAALEFYYMRNLQSKRNPIADWSVDSVGKAYVFTGPQNQTINSIEQKKEVLSQVVGAPETKPVLTGKDLMANANANINQNNEIVINIQFNDRGKKDFADFTKDHVGEYLAIFYDGRLLTCPVIKDEIPSGSAEVSGFGSLAEAREVADKLNAGSLPIPLKPIGEDKVEPTLGKETVDRVTLAGLVGLALVVVFMLLYYRLPGMIANVALCLYALYTFAIFKAVPITMSLAGIAAFILSVGMAVDANILIFERLKEELRGGKTLRAAIDAGFTRAFTAIFDSNMCTFITCAILMWYGSPAVYSFAITLFIGVAVSMFTAYTVTRTILHLLVNWDWAQKPSLYGLGTSWMARAGISLDIVGKRAYYFALSGCLILPGLYVLATSGLKPGIEFQPGTMLQASFKQPVRQSEVLGIANKWSEGSEVQLAEQGKMAFIKIRALSGEKGFEDKLDGIRDGLNKEYGLARTDTAGKPQFDAFNSVGPTISEELSRNAFWAVIIASIAIVLYLTARFAIGGIAVGFRFGVCAVIALIHDSAFILGMFAILGKWAGWEVDSLFVTAVLTIIGFSVHDTIVVYDRIRENMRHRLRGETFEQLCNRSILQTFSRSINTTLTVVLTLGALIAFGGPLMRHFYVALLVGIIIGTYSSIFCAAPLVVVWEKLATAAKTPKRRVVDEKPIVSKPMVEPAKPKTETVVESETPPEPPAGPEKAAAKSARIKRKRKRF